jgi:hypothetical protein
MISDMYIKSNHGLERSLNNYRLKYLHHLNYWKNNRQKNSWIIFENPLFSKFGKVNFFKSRLFDVFNLINQ